MSDPTLTINININNKSRVFRLPPTSWGRPRTFHEMCRDFPITLKLMEIADEEGRPDLKQFISRNSDLFDHR